MIMSMKKAGVVTCCLLQFLTAIALLPAEAKDLSPRIVTTDFPPFSFVENGQPAGIVTDIVDALLARLKIDAPIEFLPWSRAYKTAEEIPDTIVFPMARVPAREDSFHWVGPVISGKTYLFALKTRPDIQLQTLDDAKQYTIGTVRGGIRSLTLREKGFTQIEENNQAIANAKKLILGWIDLWAEEESTAFYFLQKLGYSPQEMVKAAYPLTIKSQGYLAFNKNSDAALVEAFSQAFAEFADSEEYRAILSRYHFSP